MGDEHYFNAYSKASVVWATWVWAANQNFAVLVESSFTKFRIDLQYLSIYTLDEKTRKKMIAVVDDVGCSNVTFQG